MVELLGGEDGDLVDLVGVGEGLAGERLATKQTPPDFLEVVDWALARVHRDSRATICDGPERLLSETMTGIAIVGVPSPPRM
jgi:hypothetical protein